MKNNSVFSERVRVFRSRTQKTESTQEKYNNNWILFTCRRFKELIGVLC